MTGTVPECAPIASPPRDFAGLVDRIADASEFKAGVRQAARFIREQLCSGPLDWLDDTELSDHLGSVPLDRFDAALLLRLRSDYRDREDRPDEKKLRLALQRLFKTSHSRGWTANDPTVGKAKVPPRDNHRVLSYFKRDKRLDMPDARTCDILLSDSDDWVARADWVCLETGVRGGELRGLQWHGVTLRRRVRDKTGVLVEVGGHVTILRSAGYMKTEGKLVQTKTPWSKRTIEFGPELAAILRAAMPPADRHREFVVSPDGAMVSSLTLRRERRARQDRLGLSRRISSDKSEGFISTSKLRHAFAARKIDDGIHHSDLSRMMGHRFHWITLNIYGYLFDRVAARRQARRKA